MGSLALIPIGYLISWIFLRLARGAFYNLQDPDYMFLLNSLNVVNGVPPWHVDQPGTPLQLLGALAMYVYSKLFGVENITTAVLRNPEHFLLILNSVIVGMLVVSILLVGILLLRYTGNILLSLAIQTSMVSSSTLLLVSIRVMPEPLMLTTSIWFILLLIVVSYCIDKPAIIFFCAAGLGILAGVGMGCKITFLPFLVMPLIALPKIIPRFCYVIMNVVSFYLCTLPIHYKYKYLFYWVKDIIFHVGRYGHGREGIINTSEFFVNLKKIIISEPFMAVCLTLSVAGILYCILMRKKGFCQGGWFRINLAMVIAMAIQIFMVAKHPGDNRYLVPSLTLPLPALIAMYMHLESVGWRVGRVVSLVGGGVLICCMITPAVLYDYENYLVQNRTVSDKFGALFRFANYWSGSRYTEQIKEIYNE